jgi:hypothetical protein
MAAVKQKMNVDVPPPVQEKNGLFIGHPELFAENLARHG